jgi:glycosyltransferase involved in cell wall biosynthesis
VSYIGYKGGLRWLLQWLERLNCRFATHVVTVSTDMKALLKSVCPFISAQIIQDGSASGIDLQSFAPDLYSRSDWRKLHGLLADDLVVVFVGRPVARKGFELVLRLWSDHFRDPHFKLVLCGPELVDVLKRIPAMPSNVLCLGFVSNVPEVLACSDVLILPSFHEGLSYAGLEAQASGSVVVANDISGIRCLIEDGVSGYLVPDNSLKKYIEILRHIDADRSVLEGIRRQARASVERYSRELFIPAYLSFLNGLSNS